MVKERKREKGRERRGGGGGEGKKHSKLRWYMKVMAEKGKKGV